MYIKNSKRLRKSIKAKHKASVLAKIYTVFIKCTPKCDAFGNSFFPLLRIMEWYKPNR